MIFERDKEIVVQGGRMAVNDKTAKLEASLILYEGPNTPSSTEL